MLNNIKFLTNIVGSHPTYFFNPFLQFSRIRKLETWTTIVKKLANFKTKTKQARPEKSEEAIQFYLNQRTFISYICNLGWTATNSNSLRDEKHLWYAPMSYAALTAAEYEFRSITANNTIMTTHYLKTQQVNNYVLKLAENKIPRIKTTCKKSVFKNSIFF